MFYINKCMINFSRERDVLFIFALVFLFTNISFPKIIRKNAFTKIMNMRMNGDNSWIFFTKRKCFDRATIFYSPNSLTTTTNDMPYHLNMLQQIKYHSNYGVPFYYIVDGLYDI